MIYFTAHTFKCVCHCRRAMFRVLGMYNFGVKAKHCWALSANLIMFKSLLTTSSNVLPLHLSCPQFEFSLEAKGLNPDHLLKSFLIDFENQVLHFLATLCQLTKYKNFLFEYWFLAQNLSNFVSLPWKLDNPYYHTMCIASQQMWVEACSMHTKIAIYIISTTTSTWLKFPFRNRHQDLIFGH